ncbi:hypothetical protein D9M68_937780 [compost metagenome]
MTSRRRLGKERWVFPLASHEQAYLRPERFAAGLCAWGTQSRSGVSRATCFRHYLSAWCGRHITGGTSHVRFCFREQHRNRVDTANARGRVPTLSRALSAHCEQARAISGQSRPRVQGRYKAARLMNEQH